MMKVNSISVHQYYSESSGTVAISDEDHQIIIKLTPQESHSLMAMGLQIFRDRQKVIGGSILDMSVPLLAAPAEEAEFMEVSSSIFDEDDGVPF